MPSRVELVSWVSQRLDAVPLCRSCLPVSFFLSPIRFLFPDSYSVSPLCVFDCGRGEQTRLTYPCAILSVCVNV